MIKLLDCTTRDGGHCTNWNYSDEYIFSLMSDINIKNINFFEIGYRNYYDRDDKGNFYYCTPDFLKKFYNKKGNLSLGVMVDAKRYCERDFTNAENDYIDFVRIAVHPDNIEKSLNIAETLKSRNYNIMIQLMDISNLSEDCYNLLDNWQNKNILKVLYLADTYGIINNKELEIIYKKLKKTGYNNIGFHAHNKTKQALSNSVKAVEMGLYSIDVVQSTGGINGGNLLYKEFIDFVTLVKD